MATQASESIKQKVRATIADELAVVAQRAQAFTNEIVCRASSGASAPDVGTALRVEGTFTGLCIQTGKELRCDDAETDTRVDTTAIRALGIRSMVVTPIRDEGKVVGVLAVFAPTPHAFTITHVAVLKTMADQIVALLHKERSNKKEESHGNAPAAASKTPAAKPVPQPVVIKPSAAQPLAAAVAPARTKGSAGSNVETMRPVPVAVEIAPPQVVPKREAKREQKPEPLPASKASFGTLEAVAGEPKRPSNKLVVAGVVAAVVIGGSAWAFVKMHKSNSNVQTAQQPHSSAAQPQPAAAIPPPAIPAPPVAVPPAPTTSVNSIPQTGTTNSSEKLGDKKDSERSKPTPVHTTVALSSEPSRITSTPQEPTPDVAPNFAVGSGGSSTEVNSLARVNSSAPAMMAASELVNAKVIHTVSAAYPDIAKARRISGTVVVRVTVTKDGKVSNVRFISGPIIFQDAAFTAVRQWLFKPATLNGELIEQETEIRVNFHPI
jgi:TonB family protein